MLPLEDLHSIAPCCPSEPAMNGLLLVHCGKNMLLGAETRRKIIVGREKKVDLAMWGMIDIMGNGEGKYERF